MGTFSAPGRDLSGWAPLRELVATLFEEPGRADLRGSILFDREMPSTQRHGGGTIDLKGGTNVIWNMNEDDLDHNWQVRRIERLATSLRTLMPAEINADGTCDNEVSIELLRGKINAYVTRDQGFDTDSSITIMHTLAESKWNTVVEISFVKPMPACDRLAISDEDISRLVEEHDWEVSGVRPIAHRFEDDDLESITVVYPNEVLRTIEN